MTYEIYSYILYVHFIHIKIVIVLNCWYSNECAYFSLMSKYSVANIRKLKMSITWSGLESFHFSDSSLLFHTW